MPTHASPTTAYAPAFRSSLLDYAVASDLAGAPDAADAAVQAAVHVAGEACLWDPRRFMTSDSARIRQFARALETEGKTEMAAAVRRVAEEMDADAGTHRRAN